MKGCPKQPITGMPLLSGSDACHTFCKRFIGWRNGAYALVMHDICDDEKCGLDLTVFYSERAKAVQIPGETG